MSSIQHHQLVLRVPEEVAERIHTILETENGQMHINIRPMEARADHYDFLLNEEVYPALLQNLPCVVESHKTIDMKIFLKAGDIGQILCVYRDENQRNQAIAEQRQLDENKFIPHGLTPPTVNIIKKKYSKTREKQKFNLEQIFGVMEQVRTLENKDKVRREVVEEVVDFEDWMADKERSEGIKLRLEGEKWLHSSGGLIFEHPEVIDCKHWVEPEAKATRAKTEEEGKDGRSAGAEETSKGAEEAVEVTVEEAREADESGESSDEEWLRELQEQKEKQESQPSTILEPSLVVGDEEDDEEWLRD